MSRLLVIAAVLLPLAVAPAAADDLPNPAVIGDGNSDQVVSLAGGAVTVGVDSGGSISTNDPASSSGHLAVSVDVLGEGGTVGVSNQPAGSVGIADPGTVAPGGSPAGADARPVFANGGDAACIPAETHPLSAQQIARLMPDALQLVEVCGAGTMSNSQNRALAGNGPLAGWLDERGYGSDSLGGLALSADRTQLLVSRAYAPDSQ